MGNRHGRTSDIMNETHRPRSVLRSIAAVIAGFLATFILSIATDVLLHAASVFPAWGRPMSDALFILATAYRVIYTIVGGYITARLAPDRPMTHVRMLGILGLCKHTSESVIIGGHCRNDRHLESRSRIRA
jgi:hypothetical protein